MKHYEGPRGWLFLVGIASFFLGTAVHGLTFIPGLRLESMLWIMPAVVGAFVVFAPAVLMLQRIARDDGQKNVFRTVFGVLPRWVSRAVVVLFLYTGFNFLFSLFVLNEGGLTPTRSDGAFSMQNHGHFVHSITEEEYYRHKRYEVRGVSTHPLLFLAVGIAILAADQRRRQLRRTPSEDRASPSSTNGPPSFSP